MDEGGRPKLCDKASAEEKSLDHDAKGDVQTLNFTILPCSVRACRLTDVPCGIGSGSQLGGAPKFTALVHTEESGTVLKAVESQSTFQDQDRRRFGGLAKDPNVPFFGIRDEQVRVVAIVRSYNTATCCDTKVPRRCSDEANVQMKPICSDD
jgi:hypothetical protein